MSLSIMVFLLILVIFTVLSRSNKNNYTHIGETYKSNKDFTKHTEGDADKEIQKYFPNMTEQQLLNTLYNKFIKIQKAWMNFDYDF